MSNTDRISYEETRLANEPATFGRRAAAWAIDSSILFFIWLTALLIPGIFYNTFPEHRDLFRAIGVVVLLLLPLYWFGGVWWFNARGRGPGKRLLSLAVEKDTGAYLRPELGPPGGGAGFVRTLGQALGLVPLGLGYLWAAWDERSQAWHDKMAGTQVVKLRARPSPSEDRSLPWPPLPLPPIWRRAVACLIDVGALLGLMGAVFVLSAIFYGISPDGSPFVSFAFAWLLLAPAYWFGYFWWSNTSGRSLGKRAMNLAAVCRAGGPTGLRFPGPGRGFKRTWAQLVGLAPMGIGYWRAAWDGTGRAWHDKMAGTLVLQLPRPVSAASAMPKVRFAFELSDAPRSLGMAVVWFLVVYVVTIVTTGSLFSWERLWPYILAAVVGLVAVLLSRRFRFLRGDLLMDHRGISWSAGESLTLIRYEDIQGVQADHEGLVTVRFMSSWSSTRKLWFQDPREKALAFRLEEPDHFIQELSERSQLVTGKGLPVAR